MINRREFLGITAGAGAALALTPELLLGLQQSAGKLIHRAIPSSGEMLPAIGLTFGNSPSCADHSALKEVLKTLLDNGGRVLDVMNVSSAASQEFHTAAAIELGIHNKIFWSLLGAPPGPPQPGAAAAKAQIEGLLSKLKAPAIDLAMVVATGDPAHLAVLKEAKKEGRVRHIGVQAIVDQQYASLESLMRNEPIDFIGVDYGIDNRGVEDTILPLAQERKIGVLAYFPFGGAGGRTCASGAGIFARVGTTPLPDWAADFDATTWAQFFLKYVVSHPAVTVVRTGTSKAAHMLDNLGGAVGRLPDEATRRRMAALIDSWPAAARPAG